MIVLLPPFSSYFNLFVCYVSLNFGVLKIIKYFISHGKSIRPYFDLHTLRAKDIAWPATTALRITCHIVLGNCIVRNVVAQRISGIVFPWDRKY